MNKYVLAFMFSPDLKSVWLIKKEKPEWQKGCLNGIGGKIEDSESPLEAIIRELKEEAGITESKETLTSIGRMIGDNNDGSNFEVDIFAGVTNKSLISMESEKICLYKISEIKNYSHIENVPMLIETSLYRLKGKSHFSSIIMEYFRKY